MELGVEGVDKCVVLGEVNHLGDERCAVYGQRAVDRERGASAIETQEVAVSPRVSGGGDGAAVVDHHRSHGQRVGGDRYNHYCRGGWLKYGTSYREVIACAACRGGDYQSVGAVDSERLPVDGGLDIEHR